MPNPRILTVDENNNQALQELAGPILPALSATGNDAAGVAVWFFNQPNGASTLTKVTTFAGTIIKVWAVKTGGAGGAGDSATVNIAGVASAVLDFATAADTQQVEALLATIDDANQSFTAGQSITCVAGNGAGNNAAQVYVLVAKA